jgi:hypothetical protein
MGYIVFLLDPVLFLYDGTLCSITTYTEWESEMRVVHPIASLPSFTTYSQTTDRSKKSLIVNIIVLIATIEVCSVDKASVVLLDLSYGIVENHQFVLFKKNAFTALAKFVKELWEYFL